MSKCVFCFIYYNCMIILLSVTVFVCHDKGNVFLYNKFTSICILETSNHSQTYCEVSHISLVGLWIWIPLSPGGRRTYESGGTRKRTMDALRGAVCDNEQTVTPIIY